LKTVLFICTGNTCRSSMAETLFKALIYEEGIKDIKVVSAGLSAFTGDKASPNAIQVMNEMGLDLSNHRARSLEPSLINEADIILTMTQRHKSQVIAMYPQAADKTYVLKEYIQDREFIRELAQERDQLCNIILDKRKKFLEEHQRELQAIEEKRRKLEEQLQHIEEELRMYEWRLANSVKQETRRLEEIRRQARSMDISDPFGQPIKVYKECAQELKDALNKLIEKLP
jgi:protein-tyrosine phosphatase